MAMLNNQMVICPFVLLLLGRIHFYTQPHQLAKLPSRTWNDDLAVSKDQGVHTQALLFGDVLVFDTFI